MPRGEGRFFKGPPTEFSQDRIERMFEEGEFLPAMRATGVNRIRKVDDHEPEPGSMGKGKNSKSKRRHELAKHK